MTTRTLYVPVLIETAEQAEALPVGTIAISEEFAPEVFVKDEDSWMGTHGPGAFTNESAVGLEALVPIEAQEEWALIYDDEGPIAPCIDEADAWAWSRIDGLGQPPSRRLVTNWDEA